LYLSGITATDDCCQGLSITLNVDLNPKATIMNKTVSPEIREVMNAVSYLPSVSLIMPFEPKMNLKTELSYKLKMAADKIALQLTENYEPEKTKAVLDKLNSLLSGLNYNTYKKSIAVFVSPVFEKVYYLDIPVEEKIIIDESFEIRDLVYSKKQLHKYLILILSAEWTKIFLGNSKEFIRLKSTTPDNVNAIWNQEPERVANFSDPSSRKELMLNKFLKYTDEGLGMILKATPLPVFVLGTERTAGHFKKLTQKPPYSGICAW
jgi:Bacterial archaeo-eukaryotic release factor family 3